MFFLIPLNFLSPIREKYRATKRIYELRDKEIPIGIIAVKI